MKQRRRSRSRSRAKKPTGNIMPIDGSHAPPASITVARRGLETSVWNYFYAKPHSYFAKKLIEYAGIKSRTCFGDPLTFGILHAGIITYVNETAVQKTNVEIPVGTTIISSDKILAHCERKEFETDLLHYIDLCKEWEAVQLFVAGMALFPFTTNFVEQKLGKRITKDLEASLSLIERQSNKAEWTPVTQQVMTEYFEENSWIIDKLADRILHNSLLQGLLQ